MRYGLKAKYYTVFQKEPSYAETHLFVIVQFGSLLYKGQRSIYVACGNSIEFEIR